MDYRELVAAKAEQYGIPVELAMRWVMQESGFDESAVNPRTGAAGLTQVMAATARDPGYGVTPISADDRFDPEANLDFGMQYLRAMHDKFGQWDLALAAYNAGPGAVSEAGGVPSYEETQNYVANILGSDPIAAGGFAPVAGGDAVSGEGIYGLLEELAARKREEDQTSKDRAIMSILGGLASQDRRPAPAIPQTSVRRGRDVDPLRRFQGVGSLGDGL